MVVVDFIISAVISILFVAYVASLLWAMLKEELKIKRKRTRR